MANPNVNKPVSSTSKPTEVEEAAFQKALEDEAAAIAAAQEAMALASASPAAVPVAAKPVSRPVGDVRVRVLKSEPRVLLGGRRYTFKKDDEILMDPSHAAEMSGSGWVSIIDRS